MSEIEKLYVSFAILFVATVTVGIVTCLLFEVVAAVIIGCVAVRMNT